MNKRLIRSVGLAVIAVACASAKPATALIIHPGDDPPNALSTPPTAVVGRWGTNGSAVAVSSTHVITTRHQGGDVGRTVTINGTAYRAAEITNAPGTVDLRIVRLETLDGRPANLAEFVSVYEPTDEVGQTLVLGGFGDGRGADVIGGPGPFNNQVIGYEWDGVRGTQRWGANQATATQNDANILAAWTNDVIIADFDAPGSGVFAEGTLADGDSGGGWFINDGGEWKVAALSHAVENSTSLEEAIFQPAEDLLRRPAEQLQRLHQRPDPKHRAGRFRFRWRCR